MTKITTKRHLTDFDADRDADSDDVDSDDADSDDADSKDEILF
jgi:hypothetical protein